MKRLLLAGIAAVALTISACGGSAPSAPHTPTASISASNGPGSMTVEPATSCTATATLSSHSSSNDNCEGISGLGKTHPVIVPTPIRGSFELKNLCPRLYPGEGLVPKGFDAPPTGWWCGTDKQPKLHAITFAQLLAACNTEHPGYLLVNQYDANLPWENNSQYQCLPATGSYTITKGHPPSALDVSTKAPGRRFFAVPNFTGYIDVHTHANCGEPCWAPVYPVPREFNYPTAITHGWPCQGYLPSIGQYCLSPPLDRTADQQWVRGFAESGDKIEVVCQTTGKLIKYGHGVSPSNLWDGVAVPHAKLDSRGLSDNLKPIKGMPGYYLGFIPDVELGATGLHAPPC